MTRHTYRPGDAIDPGAVYYPMDGARRCDPLEPEEVIAALDAYMERLAGADAIDPPAEHWSEWLEWQGGPCPLPPGVYVQWASPEGVSETTPGPGNWEYPGRYRYRHTTPGGWIGRGDFIPPASLWAEGSPVRCEWAYGSPDNPRIAHLGDEDWKNVTYIRLLPRNAASEPAPELPEWVEVEFDRYRIMLPAGCIVYLDLESVERIGELRDILAARRRAWL